MDFANPVIELDHYKKLCADTLRTDAPHPDVCPALKIHGVAWAIPARGQRVTPQFDDAGKVTGINADTADSWEEIEALQKAIKLPDDVVCPQCGQPTETSVKVTEDVLKATFALAARALRAQYDLTPTQLGDLLAFADTAVPEWFQPLLRWSSGLPMDVPEEVLSPDWGGPMDSLPSPPRPTKRPWWQVWKRRA